MAVARAEAWEAAAAAVAAVWAAADTAQET